MVNVVTLRKSSRLAISSGVMPAFMRLAASSTFFGYLYGRLNSASMAFISELFSPVRPKMSTTSPIGFLSSSFHCTIFTMALSPVCPPFSLSFGMNMSQARNLLSVQRNAKFLFTFSVPMNFWSFFSTISTTLASGSEPRLCAHSSTFTRSPLRACIELRSATKIGTSEFSIITLFLPLLRRTKVPSVDDVISADWYFPGTNSRRNPLSVSSSRMSATIYWFGRPFMPRATATCL